MVRFGTRRASTARSATASSIRCWPATDPTETFTASSATPRSTDPKATASVVDQPSFSATPFRKSCAPLRPVPHRLHKTNQITGILIAFFFLFFFLFEGTARNRRSSTSTQNPSKRRRVRAVPAAEEWSLLPSRCCRKAA